MGIIGRIPYLETADYNHHYLASLCLTYLDCQLNGWFVQQQHWTCLEIHNWDDQELHRINSKFQSVINIWA
jgi:hypothetical protein